MDKETIKVTPNQRKRTFTIRTFVNAKLLATYRTYSYNQDDFDTMKNNNESQWFEFLKKDNYFHEVN